MVELEFHCCICGEQNIKKVNIDLEPLIQDVIVSCQYCGDILVVEVESKHVVTNVDNQ